MIHDPERRGQALAEFYAAVAPRLFDSLAEAGLLEGLAPAALENARLEWEWCALYACVRGLVAAGGFNLETGRALDAFHAAVLERWLAETGSEQSLNERRARMAERYEEYGAIGQELEHAGRHLVPEKIGAAAARHMNPSPPAGLAEIAGAQHEALAEGAAAMLRSAD